MKPEPLTPRAVQVRRKGIELLSHLKPLDKWERDATPAQRAWAFTEYGSMAAAHRAFQAELIEMATASNAIAEMIFLEGDSECLN